VPISTYTQATGDVFRSIGDFATGLELFPALENYFHFYNHERPHQALGYQTPADLFPHKAKRKRSLS